jgi:ferrous-iron efflux pump FieF
MMGRSVKARQPENNRPGLIDYRFYLKTVLFLAGLAAGTLTGSLSLVAVTVYSGIDVAKSVIRLFPLYQPPAPPRDKAYFGFSKYPAVLGMIESILFILAACFIFREASHILKAAVPVGNYYPAIAVLAVILVVNLIIAFRTPKTAPKPPGRNARFELVLYLVVMAVLLSVQFTGVQSLDPVISIFLALLVIGKSLLLMLESIKDILDHRLPPYEEEWIKGLIREFSGDNFRLHDLNARKNGINRWIDFHLAVSDRITAEEAFNLANRLEREMIRKIPGAIVIIHVET